MEFVYIIRPHKENFVETATPLENEIMGSHFNYLKELLAEGKLILAGPETTGKFGLCVFEAANETEAKNILDNDPAVKAGVVSGELYPYRVSLFKK